MGVFHRRMRMMGRLQLTLAGLLILLNAYLIYNISTSNQSTPCYIYALLYFYNGIAPVIIALYGWNCLSIAAISEMQTFSMQRLQSMTMQPVIGTMCSLAMNGISGFLNGAFSFRVIGDFRCFPALLNNTQDPLCDNEYTTYTLFSSEWTTLNTSKWLVYLMYNTSATWLLIFSMTAFFTLEQVPYADKDTGIVFCQNATGRLLKGILELFVFVMITGLLHGIPLGCVKTNCYLGVALSHIAVLVAKMWTVRGIIDPSARPSLGARVFQAVQL